MARPIIKGIDYYPLNVDFLNDLKSLVNGEKTATLIIEDPFGQSNVVSDDVEILDIPEEELKLLKTGFSIIEDN
mgnify:CR=1 FL=1